MRRDLRFILKRNAPALLAGIACLTVVACILLLPFPGRNAVPATLSEYSSVNTICELAALRSYYHNVALYEKQPDGLFKYGIAKYGYKKLWLEYSGTVEIGIDASLIQIGAPTSDGTVSVYVPDAKVLNVDADERTLSEPISETGWLTPITGEDEANAYAAAQQAMRDEAEHDEALLRRAKNNAKLLLEQYIINTGRAIGVEYTVNWLSSPAQTGG